MSTGTEEQAAKPGKTSKAAKVGWRLYQHVAAVMAAFGLAALIGHFWEIGWRGFLATVVGVWDETVRPVVAWAFHMIVTVPLGWLGVAFDTPQLARDYLSVGLILAVSYFRTIRIGQTAGRDRLIGEVPMSFKRQMQRINRIQIARYDKAKLSRWRRRRLLQRPSVPRWVEPIGFLLAWPVVPILAVRTLRRRLQHENSALGHAQLNHLLARALGEGEYEDPRIVDVATGAPLKRTRVKPTDDELRELKAAYYRTKGSLRDLVMVVAPIPYLALLLAVNFLVLPHVS